MPKDVDLTRVMVIGSGPIVIGQAAEFDYAGSQACRSLREEGLEVILLNSNPATIMTDPDMADRVYIEPITWECAARIMERERPQGLLPTLGGQTGLNIAVELSEHGVLDQLGVRLLGTPLETIKRSEDRELFKRAMEQIGEPVPASGIARTMDEAGEIMYRIGLPLIIRPAYTLGGSGGGTARTQEEFFQITARGLKISPIHQVLIERSVIGHKELEYEIMRDGADNCVVICNMENIDPMGIHTGDSIVVAPSQTLTNREHMMLRQAAIRIVRTLGIQGGCNIQFSLNPHGSDYQVIEVNPRVSRSSALASKATGYPIAKIAAKVAVGFTLDEIPNPVTRTTTACFEPTIDYVVVKVPRWPFDKFRGADRGLGTQMKATGEAMSIDRTLEGALNKALRSLEQGNRCLWVDHAQSWSDEEIANRLIVADDERMFILAEALRRGWSGERITRLTGIDPFFVAKFEQLIELERELQSQPLTPELLLSAKRSGFCDERIGQLSGCSEAEVRTLREDAGINPAYKSVDTCAAEFDAVTPYFYSCYDSEDELTPLPGDRIVVLGGGPIRIGQGIEFDYCCVHATWELQRAGYSAIMINNNPETVSTDFDTANRLYFEPLTVEDVLTVIRRENASGAIVQCGGQTAINLARPLSERGVTILGTSPDSIDLAEDREQFDALVERLGVPRPPGRAVTSLAGALAAATAVSYPVVVRPSFVLGGRAMEIVYDDEELTEYMKFATQASNKHPVLVDRYIPGVEVEVDAICDGENVLIAGIMEHLERAGVHSGDSIAVYPAQTISEYVRALIADYTTRLARGIGIQGFLNIQFVVHNGGVSVLEVNPRASRTVPFMTKVTGIPMNRLATRVMLGHTLPDLGWSGGLHPEPDHVAVKMPVFSWAKLYSVDMSLGPEMKSTGELMGIARTFEEALARAFIGAGFDLPDNGQVVITVADRDKQEMLPVAATLARAGHRLAATTKTAEFLTSHGIEVQRIQRICEGSPNIPDLIREGRVDMVINTLTKGREPQRDGFQIRRAAAEYGVFCFTSPDTARAAVTSLVTGRRPRFTPLALQDYLAACPSPSRS